MSRILQELVPPLFPASGPTRIMLFGEAPGPLGADKSGIPFWGDRAGKALYRALEAAGLAKVPREAYADWSGLRFRELDLRPMVMGVALSNAFPVCPTRDGETFRAPSDRELRSPENLTRLRQELARAGRPLRVIGLGRRAAWVLGALSAEMGFELHELPHPSAQGLLQAAPGKGKGLKLADLQLAWEERLKELLAV